MTRPLKVYGWTGFYPKGFADRAKNCRYFVAAASKAEVYRLTGKKAHDFYTVNETGNNEELLVAAADPGVVFFWDEHNYVPRDHVAVRVDSVEA